MKIIKTEDLAQGSLNGLTLDENHSVYCGLDACLTHEIRSTLGQQFGTGGVIYQFERAMQAPYMEIMQRGFLVDQYARRHASESLKAKQEKLQEILDELAWVVWRRTLNPNSPKQLKEFFYTAMQLPEYWISQKGERKLSLNREVLEKLDELYIYARPFARLILAIRDAVKQRSVFETEIDPDGRFRAGYNIAGTETGRPSSSENAFGTASNAQNIAPGLRYVFIADPGKKFCVVDLSQVEARDVGFFIGCLFDDWVFLDNCESGDLHTLNAKRIWRTLPWPGDQKGDRELADQIFYRDFSYRDMAKRGSHLSNYYGTAWTAARSLKVPLAIMEDFQALYCRGRAPSSRGPAIEPAFPGIPRWWTWTAKQLQLYQKLVTPFGRERHFFGRPGDDTTLREAIAYLPQSTTADRMNLGFWRVWKHERRVQLLAQTYDSITFQYDDRGHAYESEIIKNVLKLIEVELFSHSGRRYVVPGEAKVGWNWGNEVTESDRSRARSKGSKVPMLNSEGLRKWSEGRPDDRRRLVGLDRPML